MQFYKHRFETVEEYLHHRPPYLLVEEIVSIEEKVIRTSKMVSMDDSFQSSHFPGAPIFPGALMQELVTQSAGILIAANYNPMKSYVTSDPSHNEFALGVLVKVNSARYKHFARPGDRLEVKVELDQVAYPLFDFRGEISVNGKQLMRNEFLLSNIQSSLLTQS